MQMDERTLPVCIVRSFEIAGKMLAFEEVAVKVFHCASHVFYAAPLFTRSSVDKVIEWRRGIIKRLVVARRSLSWKTLEIGWPRCPQKGSCPRDA